MQVRIRLDDNPRYKGSVHDDAVARSLGYKAALVPGAFLYGHMSRIAVEAWGADWVRQGAMVSRFRRPVFNGDLLAVEASPLEADGTGLRSAVSMRNEAGEEVAVGFVAMPAPGAEPAPPAAALPVLPLPKPPPAVAPGTLRAGTRTGSRQAVLTAEDVAVSLAAFDERHPLYAEAGFVHSGCLMRIAMSDVNQSFAFPKPVVLVAVEARHFAPVFPGQRLETSGIVTAVYERNGRHYFDSEEHLLADGDTVARFRRTTVFA